MLWKSEPTKTEKAKEAALTAVDLASTKAAEAKAKTEKDIVPTLAEKAEEARDFIMEKAEEAREAAAPHLEKVADATADQREAAADKVSAASLAFSVLVGSDFHSTAVPLLRVDILLPLILPCSLPAYQPVRQVGRWGCRPGPHQGTETSAS